MMYGGAYPHYPPAIPDMYGGPPPPHLAHQPPPHPHMPMHPRIPYQMQPHEPPSPGIEMYQNTVMKFQYQPGNQMHYQAPHPHQPPPSQSITQQPLPSQPMKQSPSLPLPNQQQSYEQQPLSIEHQAPKTTLSGLPHSQPTSYETKAAKLGHSVKQIPSPKGVSTPVKYNSPSHDFTASETSFTGIGTSFETPKPKSNPKPRGKFFCDVCKIDLGKDETYQNHIQGFMHTQKAAEKEGRALPKSTPGPLKNEELKPKVIKDLREKYPDQYCEVCDTTMTSDMVFQQHIQGMRHQKNLKYRAKGGPILRGRGSRKFPLEQQEAEKNIRCQKMLDESEEPLIGLQFMTEFTKNNPKVEERYVCDICNGKCDPRTLMPHIVGAKHRYNYVKLEHADLFEPHAEAFKSMRKAEKTQLMGELALAVAEREGEAQKMKAKVEIDPFYNPNKDKKNQPEAQKRTQDGKETGPPPKKVPKAKVTPNWGGPDPNKLQQQQQEKLLKEVDVGDGYRGNNSKPSTVSIKSELNGTTPKTSPANLPKNLNEIMQNLSQCLVNNEHEASMALQVSNTLTQALLQYRLKNLAKEASESKTK